MNFATVTLLGAMLSGTALRAAEPPDTPIEDPERSAKELAASIERFNALDPQSPDTLNARLSYAVFLAKVGVGDCQSHLDSAQNQLDLAKANPALSVVLPAGQARLSDAEYQIHLARAACGGYEAHKAELRNTELRAALESAQDAVALYRDAFDAVSMVTMQFNCAMVYHDLGDNVAAVSALQAAIAMDREYGYADDAEDNYSQLLQWNGQKADDDQVDERMQDFPERSATLAFDWFPSDAGVKFESDYTRVEDSDTIEVHSTREAQRHVRKGLGSWKVSFEPAQAHFDLANPPLKDPALEGLATWLAGSLLQFHDFDLARNGEFDGSAGGLKFGFRMRADAKALTHALAARGTPATQLMRSVGKALRAQLSQNVIEDLVAQDYNFETGTWVGATLDQGVWYDMTAFLSLPLEPQVLVKHEIEFAYTRPLACTDESRETDCIEIVLHATPDPAILKEMLGALARSTRLPRGQVLQLQARTDMRLIVDPVNLVAYRRDMHRYSYWSNGAVGPHHSLIESDKISVVSGRVSRTDGSRSGP
jgi:tetratricopeptide (TPR) repeat protein